VNYDHVRSNLGTCGNLRSGGSRAEKHAKN
jgi:hypothetical protein